MKIRFSLLLGGLLIAPTLCAGAPAEVELVEVFPAATFDQALGLISAGDGSGRLFVVQQNGQIRVIEAGGNVLPTPFLSLGSLVTAGGERGLLGLAFHPDYPSNGLFYLNYSAGSERPEGTDAGDTIVAEFSVSANPDIANPQPERIILTVPQDFGNHNGGNIAFGPDGYLYIGTGDGGDGGDPCNRAQTLDPAQLIPPGTAPCQGSSAALSDRLALLGKMLRIDVDNTTPAGGKLCGDTGQYAIPPDNPFADDANACAEVWAFGLRNPWRWSFDRQTGDLWIGDVGQSAWEEINLQPAASAGGENYGWKCFEGNHPFSSCPPIDHAPPVLEYANADSDCSVTGGYRYRGPVSALQGTYLFGDYCSGKIWFATDDGGGSWSAELFTTEGFGLTSFGEDAHGHVYVVRAGGLWRFEGAEEEPVFTDRFETRP